MKAKCMRYNKDLDCCRVLSDFSQPMPVLQPCIESPCKHYKPQTNFDKITESVESFAKWFVELSKTKSIDADFTYYYNLGSEWASKWTKDKQEALDGTIEWLQRECEL